MRTRSTTLVMTLLLVLATFLGAPTASAAVGPQTLTGQLPDGSAYSIEVPAGWNGTLLLYAHGYNAGPVNPAVDGGSPQTRAELLRRGYAVAGGSYPGLGWQTPVAVEHQLAILSIFRSQIAHPDRVVAWGHSMGGEITALLAEQHPEAIDGAVPMCPQVAGEVVWLNAYLDGAYTLRTLLDPTSTMPLVDAPAPLPALMYWGGLTTAAQQTPAGRARIALAAAYAGLPGWSEPGAAEPATRDYASQQAQQFATVSGVFAYFQTFVRADMEGHVGGPFSWNTGVDYAALYRALPQQDRRRVEALYAAAGLDLRTDLGALAAGARVAPTDPAAIARMNAFAQRGTPGVPVLALQAAGDNIVFPTLMRVYDKRANQAGYGPDVRESWVAAAGHCTFTTTEEVAALVTMDQRVRTGVWPATSAPAMAGRADGPSRFTAHVPAMPGRSALVPSGG